jgi:xylulokinase
MSESELLLGIDIGTTRIKALLAGPDGHVAGVGMSQTPFETVNGRVEMSLDSLRAAITAAVAPLGDERRRVIAVGIASMGETGVPIDRSGRTAGPLIAWHDQRGARVVRRLVEAFGDGLPARVGQATRTQSSIAKIGWFLQHNVNVTRWLGAAELGLWTLTGEEATEPSLACRTGAFDIRRTCFIEDVVTAVGAPPRVFPPVRTAGDSHGLISRHGAAWLGLPTGIPVTVAGHDHMVGAVGVGVNSADLLDSVGTAETLVRYASSELDLADAVAHGADVSIDPSRGGLAIMAGDLRPGQIVEAVRRMFGDASFEELNRRDQFRELEADSQNASKGDEILEELRTQGPTEAVVRLAGVRWHGLVEAMTAYMWRCAQDIEPLTGPPSRIILIGGGARSDVWAIAKRRLTRLPVARSRLEATAYGAALFAGRAAGLWPGLAAAPRHALEEIET